MVLWEVPHASLTADEVRNCLKAGAVFAAATCRKTTPPLSATQVCGVFNPLGRCNRYLSVQSRHLNRPPLQPRLWAPRAASERLTPSPAPPGRGLRGGSLRESAVERGGSGRSRCRVPAPTASSPCARSRCASPSARLGVRAQLDRTSCQLRLQEHSRRVSASRSSTRCGQEETTRLLAVVVGAFAPDIGGGHAVAFPQCPCQFHVLGPRAKRHPGVCRRGQSPHRVGTETLSGRNAEGPSPPSRLPTLV